MYTILAIVFSVIMPIIILRKDFIIKEPKLFFKNNKKTLFIYIVLIIGFLVRLIAIDKIPNGLNTDEASIGYEAYSVLNFGVDRNGKSIPVFLESWGSGQNALYMYIIMPFVKILGLSVLSVRFPMAIIGCISLIVLYKLLSKINDSKIALIGISFLAITPWHIMKSRYGLESNVFPDFMLYAVYFIYVGLKECKNYKMCIGAVFLGLCSYAYGTSYYFLPIFVVFLLAMLIKRKKITIKNAIVFIGIIFTISLPIILMLFINHFNLEEIHIGKITIPRMEENRYEKLTVLFSSKNALKNIFNNISDSIKMLFYQSDGHNANSLEFYGIIYFFSIPLTIVGLIESFKIKEDINLILNIWFIVSFTLIFICMPNINRLNILYIPLIFYTIYGIYNVTNHFNWTKQLILLFYVVSFILFEITYFNTNFTKTFTFVNGVENVIKYTKTLDKEKVYFEYSFKEPYIYVLFYNKENTNEFVSTVKYKNNHKDFDSVEELGKYRFYLPKKLSKSEDICYVMKKSTIKYFEIDENLWKITEIDDFYILE